MQEKPPITKPTIEEVRELMQRVRNIKANMPYAYGNTEQQIIETCNKLEALGFSWGDNIRFTDFTISKDYYITNSETGYSPDPEQYYVSWSNGNVGRLQFVSQKYWWDVEKEWDEFLEKLMSYKPVDYDLLNHHMVFDIENGKRLLQDYQKICSETQKAMNKVIRQNQIEEAKKKYEELLKEQAEGE